MTADLSYVVITKAKAKVTCTCGWESEVFIRGPFDPAEALVAYGVEHLKCLESPPAVFYAVAQEIHGKLTILGELLQGPDARKTAEDLAKGLAQKGMSKQVVEIKVVSYWIG